MNELNDWDQVLILDALAIVLGVTVRTVDINIPTKVIIKSRVTPCMFFHQDRNIRVVVHGVDCTILGNLMRLS